MASLQDIKGVVSAKGGLARPNLFKVIIPSRGQGTSADFSILCTNVTLPGRQLQTYDKNIGTKFEKVAYGTVTDDVSMSFLVMNDYGIKKFFDGWQRSAWDNQTYQIGYKEDYVEDIVIQQLKRANNTPLSSPSFVQSGLFFQSSSSRTFTPETPEQVIYTCKLINAFPVSMNSIQLTNELDGIIEFSVQFSYSKWTSDDDAVSSGPTIFDPTNLIDNVRVFES